ncbi:MAG: hypothetical protein PHE55_06230 [Methylococcaceae bacterium]|nr:hypothetical protein [Methylococcaceae bacterium]
MKLVNMVALSIFPLMSACAQANSTWVECKQDNEVINAMADVILIRPIGVIGTLAGSSAYLGLLPFTALAAIPEPHDAFERVGSIVVGIPFSYTFVRPIGNFCDARH